MGIQVGPPEAHAHASSPVCICIQVGPPAAHAHASSPVCICIQVGPPAAHAGCSHMPPPAYACALPCVCVHALSPVCACIQCSMHSLLDRCIVLWAVPQEATFLAQSAAQSKMSALMEAEAAAKAALLDSKAEVEAAKAELTAWKAYSGVGMEGVIEKESRECPHPHRPPAAAPFATAWTTLGTSIFTARSCCAPQSPHPIPDPPLSPPKITLTLATPPLTSPPHSLCSTVVRSIASQPLQPSTRPSYPPFTRPPTTFFIYALAYTGGD